MDRLKIDTSGIENLTKQTQALSKDIDSAGKRIQESTKPIGQQGQKISKTLEEITEKYKDLGKGFELKGSTTYIQKQIDNLTNKLANAKVKKEDLEQSGRTEGQYEDAVKNVIKYTNQIQSLKNQLESMNQTQSETKLEISFGENNKKSLAEYEKDLVKFKSSIKDLGDVFGGLSNLQKDDLDIPIQNLEISLQELKSTYPQAKEIISDYEKELSDLQNISTRLTKEPTKLKVDIDSSKVENVSNTIRDKIEEIQKRFEDSGKDFYFEGNAEQLDKEIKKVSAELDRLFNRQDKMIELGKIDTEPFKILIRDIENARNRLEILENTRPEALNRTLQENAQKASEASEKLKEFQKNLSQLEIPEIREENIDKLRNSLNKAESKLNELQVKLKNGIKMGKITESIDDSGYRKLQEQIALSEKEVEALGSKIQKLSLKTKFINLVSGAMRKLESIAKVIGKSLKSAFSLLLKPLKSVASKIGNLTKSMFGLKGASGKVTSSFSGGLKTLLKYAFGTRTLFAAFNLLKKGIQEGLGNLVQYSSETNASMSLLTNSTNQLKNSLAAAAAPLINAFAPAINQVIQLCIKATNVVNQFLSALTGQDTWIKATELSDSYADSVSGTAKAAKEAKAGIRSFDELKTINMSNSSDSGSGSGKKNLSDMFETLPVESKFKDLAANLENELYGLGESLGTALTDAMNSINWESIYKKARKFGSGLASFLNGLISPELFGSVGKTISSSLNTALKFLDSFGKTFDFKNFGTSIGTGINEALKNIDWETTLSAAATWGSGIGNTINSFFETTDLSLVGETIGNAINTAVQFGVAFVQTLDWEQVGLSISNLINGLFTSIDWEAINELFVTGASGIGTAINSFVTNINWKEISDSISSFFNTLVETVYTFVTTIDWTTLGEKLGTSISDTIKGVDWLKLGETSGETFKAFFDFISATIAGIDWVAVGESVKNFLVGIDWEGVADSFFTAVGTAIGGFAAFIGGLIGEGVQNAKQYFEDKIKEAGGNVVKGIFNGITDALKNVATWIYDHMFKPIVDGFKSAFGIHSPSTVMEEQGKFIMEGLFNGISALISKITDVFTEIKDKIIGVWDTLKEKTKDIWENGIKPAIKKPINAIIGFLNGLLGGVQKMQNGIAKALNKLSIKLPGWLEELTGMSSFGFDIKLWEAPKIPYLAEGAVFRGGKPFAAVVNDQPIGQTNIEAPLDVIRQAFKEEALLSRNNSSFGNDTDMERTIYNAVYNATLTALKTTKPTNVTFQVKSDPNRIFEIIQEKAKDFFMTTGEPAFDL